MTESAEDDRKAREFAKERFRQIRDILQNTGTEHIQNTNPPTLPLSKFGLGDLVIGFVGPNEPSAFSKAKFGWYIQLPVLKAKDDLSHVDTRFGGKRSEFVHEFIHLLDSQRFDLKDSKRVGYDEFEDGYYNSGNELNAYYQEAVADMESFLSMLPDDSDVPQNILGVDKFQKFQRFFFDEFFDDRAWRHLTSSNKRKLQTRLSKTWDLVFN